MTDYSGSIAAGGTAQTVSAGDGARVYFLLLNPPSATESLFFRVDGTATVNGGTPDSIELAPGGAAEYSAGNGSGYVPHGALSVIAATTGHKFVCKMHAAGGV